VTAELRSWGDWNGIPFPVPASLPYVPTPRLWPTSLTHVSTPRAYPTSLPHVSQKQRDMGHPAPGGTRRARIFLSLFQVTKRNTS
jgi:hypothetical protein